MLDVTSSYSSILNFPLHPTPSGPDQRPLFNNMKILYINEKSLGQFPTFIMDLLEAAVNLQKIQSFGGCRSWGLDVESFRFLHSYEKLQFLQDAEIELDNV